MQRSKRGCTLYLLILFDFLFSEMSVSESEAVIEKVKLILEGAGEGKIGNAVRQILFRVL